MASQRQTFSADIEAWGRKTQARMLAIARESAQRVISVAQSRVPVDSGFLRASIRASNSEMPAIDPKARGDGTPVTYDTGEIMLVIAGTELGQHLFVGYTASYSAAVHWGTSKMAPRLWVTLAAMEWPRIVSEVTQEAKTRVLGQ
jgi:hypothetical protein